MAQLTTDRVFSRILKECQREAEKVVKEELTTLRAEVIRLRKERDDAMVEAEKEMKQRVDRLNRDLNECEKDQAFYEEWFDYWLRDDVFGEMESLRQTLEHFKKNRPKIQKRACDARKKAAEIIKRRNAEAKAKKK